MITVIPLILLSVLMNAAAQLLLKAGMNRIGEFAFSWSNIMPIMLKVAISPLILLGLFIYVFSVTIWLLVLSRVDASIAYPMVSLGYIVTAIAAYFILNEQLSMTQMLGIGRYYFWCIFNCTTLEEKICPKNFCLFHDQRLHKTQLMMLLHVLNQVGLLPGPRVKQFEEMLQNYF